jgi:hypothetical protein
LNSLREDQAAGSGVAGKEREVKDVLRLARECGGYIQTNFKQDERAEAVMTESALTAFAARIRAEAMEDTAKACEQERIAASAHYFAAIRNLAQQGEAK